MISFKILYKVDNTFHVTTRTVSQEPGFFDLQQLMDLAQELIKSLITLGVKEITTLEFDLRELKYLKEEDLNEL